MRTPHGDIEFRRAFGEMAQGTARIVKLRPARMRLQIGRGGCRVLEPFTDVARATGRAARGRLVILRLCGARVAHRTVANILREFHKGVVVDGLPVADHRE